MPVSLSKTFLLDFRFPEKRLLPLKTAIYSKWKASLLTWKTDGGKCADQEPLRIPKKAGCNLFLIS